ncbi:lysine N(6)-hydroxylase/L-ornithine N(5)-oxygenase family protein [Millisia brevis]|uniref:lysine N(6)-hydroxylase/L-ornithine N(5)-oxygenase family protein n=1 Tax=Millisia brevis TaxID=264148 RepID=UPI000A05403A|nr:SidA/IucD/PvdA family monooxygenase [Millisia brevis]
MPAVSSTATLSGRGTVAHHPDRDPFDIVGLGFGPSNLGLAIAVAEHNADVDRTGDRRIRAAFVESKSEFGWHTGMLLPGTTMQISFLKDLATQRSATSAFTFVNYLSEKSRLSEFINHQTFFPTRLEFHDYLRWAADKVEADVRYSTSVVSIRDCGDFFEVATADGETPLRARHVVVAGGLVPHLPAGITESDRVFHNHRLLERLEALPEQRHRRFAVVGAGQSAAEVVAHLHETFPDAEVHGIFARYGYSPADDSPYANRIFDPAAVDDFYAADEPVRRRLLSYHRSTNYSCVDLPLIEELYRREYAERVADDRRLFMRGASDVEAIAADDAGVDLTVRHGPTRHTDVLTCDAVVYATGFRPMPLGGLLGDLYDDRHPGAPAVTRDYRLVTRRPTSGGIYLQGGTEHTHGMSSSLLSNIAIRSGEILDSILRASAGTAASAAS